MFDDSYIDHRIESTCEEKDRDWHHAQVFWAARFVTGQMRFDDVDPACYRYLAEVWLEEAKQHCAYLKWCEDRYRGEFWSSDEVRRAHYIASCEEIRIALESSYTKCPNATFSEVEEHIRNAYLTDSRLDSWNSRNLIEAKVRRRIERGTVSHTGASSGAVAYTEKFYESIIPAVHAEPAAVRSVLEAISDSDHQNGGSIIDCFEASVVISFLDGDAVRALWERGTIDRERTF
jgi:hypothetical protein